MPIDYSRYPANWKSEIVPAVLKRADNCCEWCKVTNKATVYSVREMMKDDQGKYKLKSIWFSVLNDALRFKGLEDWEGMEHIVKAVKVVLTIAHLDHDETNHEVSLDRLRALCQMCHLKYDALEKYRRVKEKWVTNKTNQ